MSFYSVIEKYKKFNFKSYFEQVTESDIEKSLNKEKLSEKDFLNLLSDKAEKYLEQMALKARKLTIQNFGRAVMLYMPIYVSNYCTNRCVYCGFNKDNKIKRRHLSYDEIEKEAIEIAKSGVKHILFLTGEAMELTQLDYIKKTAEILKRHFESITVEIYPMETADYAELKEIGVDGVTIYQESYDEEVYDKVHLGGKKKDFRFRLDTPERGAKAGLRQIGIGALFGLGELKKEAFLSGLHAKYLMDKYLDSEISISLPRIRACEGSYQPEEELDDKKFVQFMTAFRLFMPKVGFNVSTRETKEFRDNLLEIGITKFSAGSKTDVGGYTGDNKSTAQFETSDKRSVEEIDSMMKEKGYQPVYKDWELIV